MERTARGSRTSEQWDGANTKSSATESSLPQTPQTSQQEHISTDDFYHYLAQLKLNEEATKFRSTEATVVEAKASPIRQQEYTSLGKRGYENQALDLRRETGALGKVKYENHLSDLRDLKTVPNFEITHAKQKVPLDRKPVPVPPKIPTKDDSDLEDPDFENDLLETYVKLAKEDMDAGQYSNAEKRWQKVLQISKDKTSMPSLWSLVSCLEIQENGHEAIKILERIVQQSTDEGEQYSAHHRLAMAACDLGDYEIARVHATKALKGKRKQLGKTDPSYFESMSLLAKALENLGEDIEAEAYRIILLQNTSSKDTPSSNRAPHVTANVLPNPESKRRAVHPAAPEILKPLETSNPQIVPPSQALPLSGPLHKLTDIRNQVKKTATGELYKSFCYYLFFKTLTVTEKGVIDEAAASRSCTTFKPPLTASLTSCERQALKIYQGASTSDRIAIVKALIKDGVNPHSIYKDAINPIQVTAITGYNAITQVLLDNGAEINCMGLKIWTPLSLAAYAGHKATVKFLLDEGARVDAQSEDGVTPLIAASGNGHVAVVELLLNRGGRLNSQTTTNYSFITGTTALHMAAVRGHQIIAKMLLDKGAFVDAKLVSGYTPLFGAALSGHAPIIAGLIQRGANVNARDNDGFTALGYACAKGHLEAVKTLVMAGADAFVGPGRSAYQVALNNGHFHIINFFSQVQYQYNMQAMQQMMASANALGAYGYRPF